MFSCKDAAELISRSMDTSLPIVTRIRLRLHLRICALCVRYREQLLLIRGAVRHAAGDRREREARETLSDDARERIRNSLRNP